MSPPPPSLIANDATLHALTERLASHKALSPLMSSNLASLSPQAMAAAASAYRQPAPPPQLPLLQLVGRHQETYSEGKDKTATTISTKSDGKSSASASINVNANANGHSQSQSQIHTSLGRCKRGHSWSPRGEHKSSRTTEMTDDQIDGFVEDMGIVLRREFDVWVEQCWYVHAGLIVQYWTSKLSIHH